MKKIYKRICALILVLIFSFSLSSTAFAGLADWQLAEDISPIQVELSQQWLYADFYFLNNKIELEHRPYLATGRIYVPLEEMVAAMGGTVELRGDEYWITLATGKFYVNTLGDDTYPKRLIDVNGTTYISLFKLLAGSGYEPVFNSKANCVNILLAQRNMDYNTQPTGTVYTGYLRFEDIMADGIDPTGYYDDLGLEKLRAISDYLYKNNQKFYVAWIPLYKNPKNNIENDLTADFNLYNASFLYTLDYLAYRGGQIGLHGYTHQYNNEKSADGFEFGANTPFSDSQCIERMLAAKKVARDLGYNVSFFEFPHYGATKDQLRYAEKYFDVIYQQDTTVQTKGYVVEWTRANGKKIKYVPTPADYILNKYDISGICSRIDNCIKTQQVVSLFYHPRIDFDIIQTRTEGNVRICEVKSNTIIYQVVDKVLKNNRTFGYF